jgi:hypothetical protein
MESKSDAKKKQTQSIICLTKKNSRFTKEVCQKSLNDDNFAMMPVYDIAEVMSGNKITNEFFDELIIKLPIDLTMNMEVSKIVIKGFPFENRLDLCANGLFNHQITRCLPRVNENDDTVFDLTKKGRKMIDHYRKITNSVQGIQVRNLDKLLISAPTGFVVKNKCIIEYHGTKNEYAEFEFYPFNQFKLPFVPYWNDPRLLEKITIWSDKPFPVVVQVNDVETIYKGKSTVDDCGDRHSISLRFDIPLDSKFSILPKKSVDPIIRKNLLNHRFNEVKIIIPDTMFREKLVIETKSFKIISWETGINEFEQFF